MTTWIGRSWTSPNIQANECTGSPQVRSRSERTSELELVEPSCRRKTESSDTDEQHLSVHSPVKVIAQESSEAPDKAGTDNGHNGGIDLDCIITDTETSERVNKDLLSPELPTNTEKQDKNLSKTVLNNGNQHFLSIPSLKENPPEIETLEAEVYPDANRQ